MEDLFLVVTILFLSGIFGGFLSGLLGIGGGMVYVFVLNYAYTYFYNVYTELGRLVIANSLFVIFFSTLSSIILLRKKKLFYPKEIIKIAIPSIITSTTLTLFIVNGAFFSPSLFNGITIIVLCYILIKTLLGIKQKTQIKETKEITNQAFLISGMLTGAMASVTGLGGGTVLNPILNGRFKLSITISRSISLGVIMVSSFVVTILNFMLTPEVYHGKYTLGYINFAFSFPLAFGAILISKFGVRVGNNLSKSTILKIFSLFIIFLLSVTLRDFITISL